MSGYAINVLIGLGAVVVLVLLLAVACWLVLCVHDRVVAPWARRIEQAAFDHQRMRLAQDSWWFSEDPATTHLIQALARDGRDISQIREEWRDAVRQGTRGGR